MRINLMKLLENLQHSRFLLLKLSRRLAWKILRLLQLSPPLCCCEGGKKDKSELAGPVIFPDLLGGSKL